MFTVIKNIRVYTSRFISRGGYAVRMALKTKGLQLLKTYSLG